MFGWLGPLLRQYDLYEISDILAKTKNASKNYTVQEILPKELCYHSAFIKEHVIQSLPGINSRHGLKVSKNADGLWRLYARDLSTTPWVLQLEFEKHFPPFKVEPIPRVPLSAAKLKDLLRQEQYSPTGKLNYAHFESAPAKSVQLKANVPAPVPTLPVHSNLMVIAYYVTTPSGPAPVYLIDDPINGPRYWFCGNYF
jgi:hypothetical protein